MIALNTTAIAWVIFVVISVGWVAYYFLNKGVSRAELGSEREMAPNRKAYYDDETLEGSRLERMQLLGGTDLLAQHHLLQGIEPVLVVL